MFVPFTDPLKPFNVIFVTKIEDYLNIFPCEIILLNWKYEREIVSNQYIKLNFWKKEKIAKLDIANF